MVAIRNLKHVIRYFVGSKKASSAPRQADSTVGDGSARSRSLKLLRLREADDGVQWARCQVDKSEAATRSKQLVHGIVETGRIFNCLGSVTVDVEDVTSSGARVFD